MQRRVTFAATTAGAALALLITGAPAAHTADAQAAAFAPGTLTSQDDVTLPGGKVSLTLPAGWSAPEVDVPALDPGQGANMKIPVTVPAGATAGSVKATAKYTVRGRQNSYGDTTFTVTAP
ncbi:NEW3 domain-containing protein [Streptomyces cellulosae]